MASSNPNRHWPSMFKSKPACNSLHHHHQWNKHNDSNMNSSFIRTSYTSGGDQEERSAEPKPRWNPKPEQIRILEAIFNSGMVNPPRDEIRKIRAQLQEYGQVGDANVFYWFQNRKSRSKHKLRQSQNLNNNNNNSSPKEIISPPPPPPQHNINKALLEPNNIVIPISSTTPPPPAHQAAQAQAFFYIPVQQNGGVGGGEGGEANKSAVSVPMTQGFCFSTELSGVVQLPQGPRDQLNNVGSCTNNGVLLNELMTPSPSNKNIDHDKAVQMQHIATVPPPRTTTFTLPSPISHISPGASEDEGRMKWTVFINDVAFEVDVGPLNVREAFGDDAVLIHVSGQPVLVDQWGVTLHPLQHGASYYLI